MRADPVITDTPLLRPTNRLPSKEGLYYYPYGYVMANILALPKLLSRRLSVIAILIHI